MQSDYHCIVINLSQKDQQIFRKLNLLSSKTVIPHFLILHKIRVSPDQLQTTVSQLQDNMRTKLFYAHLYRDKELIVVYKSRVLYASPDKATWSEIISYGRSLHIPSFWLDFKPCRFEDEDF